MDNETIFFAQLANQAYLATSPFMINDAVGNSGIYVKVFDSVGMDIYKEYDPSSNPTMNIVYKGTNDLYTLFSSLSVILDYSSSDSMFNVYETYLQGLLQETLTQIQSHPGMTKINLIGHSIGGVIARDIHFEILTSNLLVHQDLDCILFNPLWFKTPRLKQQTDLLESQSVYNNDLINNVVSHIILHDFASHLMVVKRDTTYTYTDSSDGQSYTFNQVYGYGQIHTYPAVSTILSGFGFDSYTDWLNYGNHKIENFIGQTNSAIPAEILNPTSEITISSLGATYQVDDEVSSGVPLQFIITSLRSQTYPNIGGSHHLHLKSEDSNTVQANAYTAESDINNEVLKYRWKFTEYVDSLGNGEYLVYTYQDGSNNNITAYGRYYTVENMSTGIQLKVLFQKVSSLHLYALVDYDYSTQQSPMSERLFIQHKQYNPTNLTRLGGVDLNFIPYTTYTGYANQADKNRALWDIRYYNDVEIHIDSSNNNSRRLLHHSLYDTVNPPYVPFTAGSYASLEFEQWSGKAGVLDTPAGQYFMLESMKYPGEYLTFSNGQSGLTYGESSVNGSAVYSTSRYYVAWHHTTTNPDSGFKWHFDGGTGGSLKNYFNSNHINEQWHGADTHVLVQADNQLDQFAIDTDWSSSHSGNSQSIGLLYILGNKKLAYPYNLESGNIPSQTSANVNNVPLEAKFKVIWC